jgi:hypothetical protein
LPTNGVVGLVENNEVEPRQAVQASGQGLDAANLHHVIGFGAPGRHDSMRHSRQPQFVAGLPDQVAAMGDDQAALPPVSGY